MKKVLSSTLIAILATSPLAPAFAEPIDTMHGLVSKAAGEGSGGDPLGTLKIESSPFEVCQDKAFISRKLYQQNKAYWDQAMEECGNDLQLEVIGDTGFFQSMLKKLQSGQPDGAKSVEFLQLLAEQAKKNIETSRAFNQAALRCAENPATDGCENILGGLQKQIDKVRPNMRQALALSAYGQRNQQREFDESYRNVNNLLEAPTAGLHFDVKRVALSTEELADAVEQFDDDSKEIQKAYDESIAKRLEAFEAAQKAGRTDPQTRQWAANAASLKGNYKSAEFGKFRTQKRYEKMEGYRQAFIESVYKAPVLAVLNDKDAGAFGQCLKGDAGACKAVAEAQKKLEANAVAQIEKINDMLNPTVSTRAGKAKRKGGVADMIELMAFMPTVKKLLEKNPAYCGAATELVAELENKGYRDMGLLIGGAVAGTIASAGVGSVIGGGIALGSGATLATGGAVIGGALAGGVSGYAFYKHDADKEQDRNEKFLSRNTDETGEALVEIKDLQEAKDALALNIATSPLNLVGTGIFKGAAAVATGALAGGAAAGAYKGIRAASIKAGANRQLREAMKAKGYSEEAVTKLVNDLNGKDVGLARQASQTLMKALDLDDDMINVVQAASSRGLISGMTQRSAIKAIREEVADGKDAAAILKTLEKLNPAKINEVNRAQTLDLVMSASKFGLTPENTARIAGEWTEGVDALSSALRKASKNLERADVKALPTAEARQERALQLALREKVDDAPAYKGYSDAQKDDLVASMSKCPLPGKK